MFLPLAFLMTLGLAADPAVKAAPIILQDVLIKPIDEVAVPARVEGPLAQMEVAEGDIVTTGQLLANLEDNEAQLTLQGAEIALEIARTEAENDVNIRFARKSLEVAQSELKRATDSVEKVPKSVSASDLDRLRLLAQRAELELEQAERNQRMAQLTARSKQNDVELAAWDVKRRRVLAPLGGMVVEVKRRIGEWVPPGETVLRLLQLDKLRAEAFLSANDVDLNLVGRDVVVLATVPGKGKTEFRGRITFVSPEINPVNGQFRIWAEIENPDLRLRPGQRATMTIAPARP